MSDALNNLHRAYTEVIKAAQRSRDELREVVRTQGDRTSLNLYMAQKRDADEHLERLLRYNAGALIAVALSASKAVSMRNGAKGDLATAYDDLETQIKQITCPLADAVVGYLDAMDKQIDSDESWAVAALSVKAAAKARMRKCQTIPVDKTATSSIVRYVLSGHVRGIISYHQSLTAARRAKSRDLKSCAKLGRGAYSDARIFAVHKDGTHKQVYDDT